MTSLYYIHNNSSRFIVIQPYVTSGLMYPEFQYQFYVLSVWIIQVPSFSSVYINKFHCISTYLHSTLDGNKLDGNLGMYCACYVYNNIYYLDTYTICFFSRKRSRSGSESDDM